MLMMLTLGDSHNTVVVAVNFELHLIPLFVNWFGPARCLYV